MVGPGDGPAPSSPSARPAPGPASGGPGRCRRGACFAVRASLRISAPRSPPSRPDRRGRWRAAPRPVCAPGSPRRWSTPATTVARAADGGERPQDVALHPIVDHHHLVLRASGFRLVVARLPASISPPRAKRTAAGTRRPLERDRALPGPAQARAWAISASRSNWPSGRWAMTPCGMPRSRIDLVSARVSTPRVTIGRRAASASRPGRCRPASWPGRKVGASRNDPALTRRRLGRATEDLFQVIGVGPHIADMREGEGDDLGHVGGVGQDLL